MQYGQMTKAQAIIALADHEKSMKEQWIRNCINYMQAWEKVRSPERWQRLSDYHKKMVIRGWIYQRRIRQGIKVL